ncbi:MAG: transglutaminase domain-containing protein [bacterium]|nr:transglutaminase domain-containing protein [bacterium]
MRTPPFLISATLLLWGWQNRWLVPAVVMILIIEGVRFQRTGSGPGWMGEKWEIPPATFRRIADFCLMVMGGMLVYYLVTETEFMVLRVTSGMPFAFFLLYAAQLFSDSDDIDVSTLFLQKFRKKTNRPKRETRVHFSYPYFVLCIMGAAGNYNMRKIVFFVFLFLLVSWAMWKIRPKRYHVLTWGVFMLAAFATGVSIYTGFVYLEFKVNTSINQLFSRRSEGADLRVTAIGKPGVLKESESILFRVTNHTGQPGEKEAQRMDTSILLREQTFDIYRSPAWYVSDARYKDVAPGPGQGEWQVVPRATGGDSITVSTYLTEGSQLLQLPAGASYVQNLPVASFRKNILGSIKVEDGPGILDYRVTFQQGVPFDQPPGKSDLKIPPRDRKTLLHLVNQLNLNANAPEAAVETVKTFFRDKFTYSLVTMGKGKSRTALSHFLKESRAGHCEYFATATVLLLRAAGIPARYVSGFSAHEYSSLEERIVVREKHAHAWSLVYLEGTWQTLDTTPGLPGSEVTGFALGKWFADIYAFVKYKFILWRWKLFGNWWPLFLLLLISPYILYLARKYLRKIKRKKPPIVVKEEEVGLRIFQTGESPFHLLEEKVKPLGLGRYPGETSHMWLQRIETVIPAMKGRLLPSIIAFHYRERFSTTGLTPTEQEELKDQIKALAEQIDL